MIQQYLTHISHEGLIRISGRDFFKKCILVGVRPESSSSVYVVNRIHGNGHNPGSVKCTYTTNVHMIINEIMHPTVHSNGFEIVSWLFSNHTSCQTDIQGRMNSSRWSYPSFFQCWQANRFLSRERTGGCVCLCVCLCVCVCVCVCVLSHICCEYDDECVNWTVRTMSVLWLRHVRDDHLSSIVSGWLWRHDWSVCVPRGDRGSLCQKGGTVAQRAEVKSTRPLINGSWHLYRKILFSAAGAKGKEAPAYVINQGCSWLWVENSHEMIHLCK